MKTVFIQGMKENFPKPNNVSYREFSTRSAVKITNIPKYTRDFTLEDIYHFVLEEYEEIEEKDYLYNVMVWECEKKFMEHRERFFNTIGKTKIIEVDFNNYYRKVEK